MGKLWTKLLRHSGIHRTRVSWSEWTRFQTADDRHVVFFFERMFTFTSRTPLAQEYIEWVVNFFLFFFFNLSSHVRLKFFKLFLLNFFNKPTVLKVRKHLLPDLHGPDNYNSGIGFLCDGTEEETKGRPFNDRLSRKRQNSNDSFAQQVVNMFCYDYGFSGPLLILANASLCAHSRRPLLIKN